MGLINTVAKDRKIYGNCKVLSPDGHLMFRCDDKKSNWYLSRNLAEIVDNDPLTIKLLFDPNGLGNHNKKYGLTEMDNICVVCGTQDFLTRHHVVPYCYRKYFPSELKSHKFHDILSLCVNCHEIYEKEAFQYKIELFKIYNAPIGGDSINNKDILKVKRLSYCLDSNFNRNIPKKRVAQIKNEIKLFFGWKRISKKRIDMIINKEIKVYNSTHGEMVVSQLKDYSLFIKDWRNHFINNNDCKFLPKNWSVDNE